MQKGFSTYRYIDYWLKSNETLLPVKEEFYIPLNMNDITDADYTHWKGVCKDIGKYHDLYVQSNTLLLADVSENFRKMCLEINELDSAKFISALGSAL